MGPRDRPAVVTTDTQYDHPSDHHAIDHPDDFQYLIRGDADVLHN
jgi:hypothetical protein